MDKRLINFMLISMLIIIGYMQINMILFPPKPKPVAEELADPNGDEPRLPPDAEVAFESEGQDGGEGPLAEVDPSPGVHPGEVPHAGPREPAEFKRLAIGSVDHTDGTPMLVTFVSRGGAVERIELADPRYRDLEDKSAYIGHLATDEHPDGGVRVNFVGAGTPAFTAGIQVGDAITQVGDESVNSPLSYRTALEKFKAGAEVPVRVNREGTERTLTITSMRRPLEVIRPEPLLETESEPRHQYSYLLGLKRLGRKVTDFNQVELPGLPSLREENWHATTFEEDGLTKVEFRFPLGPEELAKLGVEAGSLEIVKRFWLQPSAEDDVGSEHNYHFEFEIEVVNHGATPVELEYRLDGPTGLPLEGWWYSHKTRPGFWEWGAAGVRDIVWRKEGGPHVLTANPDMTKAAKESDNPQVPIVETGGHASMEYVGVDAQFFNSSLLRLPDQDARPLIANRLVALAVESVDPVRATRTDVTFRLDGDALIVGSGQSSSQRYRIFAGPKKPSVLANYGLDECIVYGWFWWSAKPMGQLLHALYQVVRNYGIAIILLTVVVRACMFPLGRQQAMMAKKMQELTPEIKKIKEKYPNDMEKQSAAQQELFRKHKYNPATGCLPMFVQLPIFIGLYRALSVDIELRQAPLLPGFAWCSNLSSPDMFLRWDQFITIQALTGYTGWLGPYLNVLPLISMGLFMVHQQMFTPPPTDEQQEVQQKVMKFMTLFIGVLFFKVPAGLCLYFITSSMWAMGERLLLPKKDEKKAEQTPISLAKKERVESKAGSSKGADGSNGTAASAKRKWRKKNRR